MILEDIAKRVNLNENEKQILQYITEYIDVVPYLSSRELARRTYTSSTAVLRMVKKLGFSNYNDFKLNISSYLKNQLVEETLISENEELLDLMNKMSELEKNVITQTKDKISLEVLQKVVEKLNRCTYIDIVANNVNAEIAKYARYNFGIAGKIVSVHHNSWEQIQLALNVPKDHVVMIITKYGKNQNLLRTAKVLKKRGISTIAVISDQNKEMENLCDYTFYCAYNNAIPNFVEMIFNISTKFILDLLYVVLFSKNYDTTSELNDVIQSLFYFK